MYEVCLESTLQLFLQSGVLLFQLFYTEPGTYEFQKEKSYVLDLVSITTSVMSILYGLSSFKINVTQAKPNFSDKLVLMIRSSFDIIPRLNLFNLFIIFFEMCNFIWAKLQKLFI